MKQELAKAIKAALAALGLPEREPSLEHPGELSHGDYSTNIALKTLGPVSRVHNPEKVGFKWTVYEPNPKFHNPRELAESLVVELQKLKIPNVEKIEPAGPGFINFHLSKSFFAEQTAAILASGAGEFGTNDALKGQHVICEYTQPNPFKLFHIGHMMNNMVGESLSRLIAASGAEVKRVTYHGDVGLHVAKTLWGVLKLHRESAYGTEADDETSLAVPFLGKAYALGNTAYEDDESAKAQLVELNKKIYSKSDSELNALYDEGKKASLDYFKKMYELLGSHFDHAFFESETAPVGKKIVESHIADGIFTESDGAVVFKGETRDPSLHTRVFISKEGIPTYESKDIGLVELKREWAMSTCGWKQLDHSITVTAEEQTQYFRVVKKAIELVFPEYTGKIEHIPHGMLKLPSGKMSSRTGTVITADDFIFQIRDAAKEKMMAVEKTSGMDIDVEKVALQVALAAIRYSILKQAPGRDVIFDVQKSLSFEGDSGPYLQYTAVRAASILEKAKAAGITPDASKKAGQANAAGEVSTASGGMSASPITTVEKLLYRFPEVVAHAREEYAPQHLVTYLTDLASSFNSYYAATKIIDTDAEAPYRVALAAAVRVVLKNGLTILGIEVPEKM